MKRFACYTFILSILILSCRNEEIVSPEEGKILISEPIRNRVVDDGRSPKHDKDCVGFYHTHFSPGIIDSKHFMLDGHLSLKEVTGLTWGERFFKDSIINFTAVFPENVNQVVYVAEMVESETAERKILSIGSDDGFTLWVNGDSVASVHKGRAIVPHHNFISVDLRKGNNIFLYKIDQGDGGWAFFRKLMPQKEVEEVIASKISELYRDLPEWCILPDTATARSP